MSGSRSALLLLALAGCPAPRISPLVANTDPLERDVLTAAIPDVASKPNTFVRLLPVGPIQVDRRGQGSGLARFFGIPQDSLSPADLEAETDFDRRNANVKGPVDPGTGTEPTIRLSYVGFSRDHRTALVFVAYHCGALCGNGRFEFLERDATNVWHIVHEYNEWLE
jgi:hypothetical protein